MLKKHTAVSKEVCLQMAKSIQKNMNVNVSVATSGYAGSSNINKSLGLVYIACCVNDKSFVKKINLEGTRKEIINKTSNKAIGFTIKKIQKVFRNK